MTAPKRMAMAFGCVLLAFSVFAIVSTVPTAVRYGLRHSLVDVAILPVYLLFTLPGWVLALPFVLLFKSTDGWRTWVMLAIGTAIGPCFILGWSLLASGHLNWQGDGASALMALFIGFLTTVFYVLLLRRFTIQASTTARQSKN